MTRELHLNLFINGKGHHEAAWRHPQASALRMTDFDYYQGLAAKAEAAAMDAIFLADLLVLNTDVGGSVRGGLEPVTTLGALAASTSRIGLIATASTTYSEPYNLARQFSTLDHISRGRIGWNIVTTYSPEAGRNFGQTKPIAHAERYTLCYAAIGPMNIMPAMQSKVPYDPIKDFRAIAVISMPPMMLLVHPSFPAQTLQQFVDYARANDVDYASGGPGSIQHLSGELMRLQFGLKLRHVPYRGAAPAAVDVTAGVVPVMFDSVSSGLPLVQSGKLRALGLTAGDGLPSLPGVPSITKVLSADYSVIGWSGMLAPAGVSDEIIERVNRDLLAGLDDPNVVERLKDIGLVPAPRWSPTQAQKFVNDQTLFWRKIVHDAGIRIDG
jgi:tripartite-type tricarboxylate transporter receptor subunit TctC